MRNRWLGIAALLIAFLLATAVSIEITGFNISDSAQGSYVVVVMLMLFLFIIFSSKEDIEIEARPRNIIYGVATALIFFLVTSFLRGKFSFLFLSYRLDALLFPIILISLIITLFGKKGLFRMKWLVFYSAFASPVLLLPLLSLNGQFTALNAQFVYTVLKLIGEPVIRNGLVISAAGSSSITISKTCTDIAAFVGIAMFMLPLAYMFDGRRSKKLLWVVSGVVMLLVFNFGRMLFISLEWIYYGVGPAVSVFHTFAGQILFDLAIVIMVLLFGKFGLSIPTLKRRISRKRSVPALPYIFSSILVGIFFMVITTPYLSSASVPYSSFYGAPVNATNQSISLLYLSLIKSPASTRIYPIGPVGPDAVAFGLFNKSTNTTDFMTFSALGYPGAPSSNPYGNTSFISSYILNNGAVINAYDSYSNGTEIYIDSFSIPTELNGKYISAIGMEISEPGPYAAGCGHTIGYVDRIESSVYTFIKGGAGHGPGSPLLCASYYTAMGG
jgi:Transmembrane exosortase (Exosortase_EpsH).